MLSSLPGRGRAFLAQCGFAEGESAQSLDETDSKSSPKQYSWLFTTELE
jgi:hypothetical protein